ncbi:protein ACCELERATED CELL DEATH 6-like [Chenopodium quinoa]|uniref:PGG domain-containing protein n=1 Tax=Chenopodium quinoa TaxID=63459 RepID=A0A803MSP9_CHEQI|nr:protein ACCELERATED CELL DEATH 6-like [Chenopodium quinoa]
MDSVLYNAATLGNVSFLNDARNNELESGTDEYFLKQTEHKNNILHLAIPRKHFEFVEEVILNGLISKQAIDELIKQANKDGNTPVHVAAEVGNVDMFKLLHDYGCGQTVQKEGKPVFMMQNVEGNTPLHVALIHANVEIAKLLVETHPDLVYVTNTSKETPLHLATMHQPIDVPIKDREAALAYLDMIKVLLEKDSSIACLCDEAGSTPLHRAASIISAYNLQIIKLILYHCPQSAELRDGSRKTILHLLKTIPNYKEGKDLLGITEVFDLRNHQDQQGNTPLHAAAINMNLNLVRVLVDSSARQSIRNKDGISAASLIQEKFERNVEKNQMTMDVCEATDRASITFLKGRLHNFGSNFLFSRDSERRNVVHKLMQINNGTTINPADYIEFIQQVLESFPEFICQTDRNGDTPVHILVRNPPNTLIRLPNSDTGKYKLSRLSEDSESDLTVKLLDLSCRYFTKAQEEASVIGARYDPPWLVQNIVGNTPLHEALIVNQSETMVLRLIELDIEDTAKLINKLNQTPLHLIAGCPLGTYEYLCDEESIKYLVKANEKATHTHDNDGLTPLLRAAKSGNVKVILTLLKNSSHDTKMLPDQKYGQTFWHLLVKQSNYSTSYLIKSRPELRSVLIFRDFEGNTPLHLAIKAGRFDHAINFLKDMDSETVKKLLEQKNDAGITSGDIIRSAPEIPDELEAILNEGLEFIGYRSVYGISTADMDKYVDTIGVIAALLMTVTFTAAFTVPGGQNQETSDKVRKGTPILVKRMAFQAFMFFDISAMCLSTMVLFCLLWILAAGNKGNSVILMDFSIFLLLISFYTTLLTFMTAVYATTIYVQSWIAVYTLIICSLLMLLMHKFVIVEYIGPIGPSFTFYRNKLYKHFCECILLYETVPENIQNSESDQVN